MRDREGRARRLPCFFYEVDAWATALELRLTTNFMLWEFIEVDVREIEPLRMFPRYIPCAVTVLAAQLEIFRQAVGTYIHIAANGGYRSPSHKLSRHASTHCWGAAANIYLIGDDRLDSEAAIRKYAQIASDLLPGIWVRPYGSEDGQADDHLHLDLGYVTVVPREAGSELETEALVSAGMASAALELIESAEDEEA
jgi:hypothetical protein